MKLTMGQALFCKYFTNIDSLRLHKQSLITMLIPISQMRLRPREVQ